MSIFAKLDVYHDNMPRSAAINMAIDEALLEHASVPSIRFYRWDQPALSFGYFGKFVDVADYRAARDVIRRWTGGGMVFHGDDLTYAIIIPVGAEFFPASSKLIYAAIHSALRDALRANDEHAELVSVPDITNAGAAVGDSENSSQAGRGYNGACFANPVHADVVMNGRKVAGAAQRRTRSGLLQQGSIQHVDFENGLAERFAKELSEVCSEKSLSRRVLERAQDIAQQKYGSNAWLRRR